MFNFKDLISKYSKGSITHYILTDGYYDYGDGGKWKEEVKPVEITGAIVPLSLEETRYEEGGHMTVGDMKLYCYVRLGVGEKIIHTFEDGTHKDYKILAHKDYSNFDKGLHIYTLKRVDNDESY